MCCAAQLVPLSCGHARHHVARGTGRAHRVRGTRHEAILLLRRHGRSEVVGAADLESWGVSFEQALSRALRNLRHEEHGSWTQPEPGILVFTDPHGFAPTRLLIDASQVGARLSGLPVAFVCSRHQLVLVGSADRERIARIAGDYTRRLADGIAIHWPALVHHDGRWKAFGVRDGHPLQHSIAMMRCMADFDAYSNDHDRLPIVGPERRAPVAEYVAAAALDASDA